MENSIDLQHVSKIYKLYKSPKEKYFDIFLPKSFGRNFYALSDVNFQALPGDSIGIIGLNGSGKSTLANIIARCSMQTSGNVVLGGSASMVSFSSGIDPKLSGTDNIIQKGLLLGFRKEEIKAMMPKIIEFSELQDFINQPVKNYSSGMKAKLGFAITINIDPDILVIDEALSVGDPTFTAKCLDAMDQFRQRNNTSVFISHALGQVRDFCNKVLWLEGGKVRAFGECREVIKEYSGFIKWYNELAKSDKEKFMNELHRSQFVDRK